MKYRVVAAGVALVAAIVLWQGIADPGYGQGKKGKETKVTAKQPPYVHAVVFYLKKDAPKGTAATVIRDCHEILAKIPTVKHLWAGRPARMATDIAAKDYDVGLMILFDNYDGLKTYLDHPQHLRFVKKHEKSFEKVSVYDFNNQSK